MSIRRRFLAILAAITVSFIVLLPTMALAVDIVTPVCTNNGISDSAVCKDAKDGQTKNPLFGPDGVLTKVISVLSIVTAIIAVIIIIIAGIRFVLSGGDPQKVASARNTIIYAAVGLAVAALAQALVQLILDKLT